MVILEAAGVLATNTEILDKESGELKVFSQITTLYYSDAKMI